MKKEEILTTCIDEIRSGKSSIEDCIARYPEFDKDLRSLLEIGIKIIPDDVKPTPEFKMRARAHLFNEDTTASVSGQTSGWWRWREFSTPARALAGVVIALIVIVVTGGSTVYAAQNSLPGD